MVDLASEDTIKIVREQLGGRAVVTHGLLQVLMNSASEWTKVVDDPTRGWGVLETQAHLGKHREMGA